LFLAKAPLVPVPIESYGLDRTAYPQWRGRLIEEGLNTRDALKRCCLGGVAARSTHPEQPRGTLFMSRGGADLADLADRRASGSGEGRMRRVLAGFGICVTLLLTLVGALLVRTWMASPVPDPPPGETVSLNRESAVAHLGQAIRFPTRRRSWPRGTGPDDRFGSPSATTRR